MGPIVCKFGGSSVENSEAMARCGDILRKYSDVKIAIISATYNTTNELENLARACVNGTEQEAFSLLDQIRKKHTAMAEGLRIDRDAFKRIDQIMVEAKTIAYKVISTKKLDPAIMDRFYCLGERLSSSIFFNYMKKVSPNKNIHFLDARDVIITNSNFSKAEPDFKRIKNKTKRKILSILEDENALIITQGFIGSDSYGNTTTLGREGSDYSASILAWAIDAKELQIWTDVNGISTADPRINAQTKMNNHLSYDEATCMAELGAKVLFKRTLEPAKLKSIPVFVGSSIRPDMGGTFITLESKDIKFKGVCVNETDDQFIVSIVGPKAIEFKSNIDSLMLGHDFSFAGQTPLSLSYGIRKFENIFKKDIVKILHDFLVQANESIL